MGKPPDLLRFLPSYYPPPRSTTSDAVAHNFPVPCKPSVEVAARSEKKN